MSSRVPYDCVLVLRAGGEYLNTLLRFLDLYDLVFGILPCQKLETTETFLDLVCGTVV